MTFSDSYLGKRRKIVGSRLIHIPRIVVHDPQERLLELRSDFNRCGLPGGHHEDGDNSAETAIREVFELELVAMRTPVAAE